MRILVRTAQRIAILEAREADGMLTVPPALWQYPAFLRRLNSLPMASNDSGTSASFRYHPSGTAAPASTGEAIALQQSLRHRVVLQDDFPELRTIAGIDVGYDPRRNLSRAALVVMRDGDIVESVIAHDATPFPYVPGLLSFREAPVILKALASLNELPDLLFIDGHGVAHPRRLGIAAHIGVLTGLPAIGVAKKVLCGTYREPGLTKGERSELIHQGEMIGTVLRSKDNVKPLIVSPGHRVSHATAVRLVQEQLTRYRLPEPTRLADMLSKMK